MSHYVLNQICLLHLLHLPPLLQLLFLLHLLLNQDDFCPDLVKEHGAEAELIRELEDAWNLYTRVR